MRKNAIIVAAIIWSSTAQAQLDPQASMQDTAKSLNEVVVTANKFSQKQSNTGKVVTVITPQQIERSAGKDLAQLLNEQAGITVSGANSNPGKDKSLFLRGASSSYTLFLLDGVPLNDPSGVGGTFDIRLISLSQVERIEILKGSQSTLYGSNAIAGVVNIISKKATTSNPQSTLLLSYGSYDTKKGAAGLSQKGKVFEYNVNYEYFKTKGISEAKDTTGKANFDNDGFDRHAVNAIFGINVTDQIKLSPYYRFSEYKGNYDADAFEDGANKYHASLINTGLLGRYTYNGGTVSFNYGYDYTRRSFKSQFGTYAPNGKFNHVEAYVNHNFCSYLQLVAGLNYQAYNLPEIDTTNSIMSTYASLLLHTPVGFNLELGGRFNHPKQYDENVTYSFNPSYLLKNQLKLFVNLSSGFRAPGIDELFGPFGANPGLKPERSTSMEGGVQAWTKDKKLSALATYFKRNIKDVIIYDFARGYNNRDKQIDHGVELELDYVEKQWNIRATYAYVDGEITQKLSNKDTTFFNLIRRPKHTINLFVGYQLTKNLFVSSSLQSFSERKDLYYNPSNFSAEPRTLKAYALWNAYAEYSLEHNKLKLFVDAKNLTDKKDYYEVYGYNVQGINVNGGVRFSL